ncbi:FAD/NAD(P)-binding domain-containing protein [Xylariaceae sp. FL0016]|nr:FAD/NAD(P)-binding domain-containing protein [Xylariaceae sp. FL0016]
MEAHSISFTSASQGNTSRIGVDLKAHYRYTAVELDDTCVSEEMNMSLRIGKRRAKIVDRRPHVGIIGAGLAGLRAADVLLQHNFQVTLIEGRNRVGGRVHQAALPNGRLVDAGPNWIHGTDNNPILGLAKETNTTAGSFNRSSVVSETGQLLSPKDGAFYSDMMWDIIGAAFSYSNQHSADIDPQESLWQFFEREVSRRVPQDSSDSDRRQKILYQLAETWGAFVGSHVRKQSLKFFWLEECIEGENLLCEDTYQKILGAIAKPAMEGAEIKYKTVIRNIQSTCDDGDQLQVHTMEEEKFEFDEVVVTTPLGWLKQHPEAFNPPLPSRLREAIKSIGYGCLEKVYISFPKAFWHPESGDRIVEGFIQMLSPAYAADSNPRRWNQEIVELASLSAAASQPTLLFYMYGQQSAYITGEVARIPTKEKQEAFLYEWFKPYYSKLPFYDERSPACQPSACFATEWLQDELAGNGSYSNFQVGLQEGDKDVEIMRDGLPDRGLWFAGEHTAPFVALGTVTGAYWSGESVGKRIAQAYCRGVDGVTELK